MSLVGTRPILPDELEQYELHHRARIAIKPGITGMWQVSGRSDITDFEEIVRLDTEYISEWNIGLDMLASYFEVKKTAEDHLLYHSLSHSGKKAVLEYEKSERFSELKNNKIIEAFNKLLDEIYNMEV